MGFFNLFKNNQQVLLRCTECAYEEELSVREVYLLKKQNRNDSLCPFKEPCHICHIGFMIPVNFTDNHGKQFLFHEIKPHIKNLDPDTVMDRIFDPTNDDEIHFFGFPE